MKQFFKKKNPFTQKLFKWKEDQKIISVSPDEMRKILEKVGSAIIEYKMDGELAFYSLKENLFASLKGRIRKELPVLDELKERLSDFKDIEIIGELVAVDKKGNPLRFNETMSIIRDPTEEEEERIIFYPFEVYSINGKVLDNKDLEVYEENFDKIRKIFKNARYIRPVYSEKGKVKTFNKIWQEWAEKKKQEGVVVRTDERKIYKVKTVFSFDAVIIFITKGTGRLKGLMGASGVALMDEDRNFRFIGLVGTGWTDEIRREIWNFAQKNKAEIKKEGWQNPPRTSGKEMIWVKPQIIIEIKWKDILFHLIPSYQYARKKWSYVGDLPSVIMREPRFVRFREDKTVKPSDLRLTQIPDWEREVKKLEKQMKQKQGQFYVVDY